LQESIFIIDASVYLLYQLRRVLWS